MVRVWRYLGIISKNWPQRGKGGKELIQGEFQNLTECLGGLGDGGTLIQIINTKNRLGQGKGGRTVNSVSDMPRLKSLWAIQVKMCIVVRNMGGELRKKHLGGDENSNFMCMDGYKKGWDGLRTVHTEKTESYQYSSAKRRERREDTGMAKRVQNGWWTTGVPSWS